MKVFPLYLSIGLPPHAVRRPAASGERDRQHTHIQHTHAQHIGTHAYMVCIHHRGRRPAVILIHTSRLLNEQTL